MAGTDWDKEMKKIDKQLESISDEALISTTGAKRAGREGEGRGGAAHDDDVRRVRCGSMLAVVLGVGMLFWPYSARCGPGLFAYLVRERDGRGRAACGARSGRGAIARRRRTCSRCCSIVWGLVLGGTRDSAAHRLRHAHRRTHPVDVDVPPDAARRSSQRYYGMKTFKNFVAGAWVEPSTGEYFENVNPADTTDVIGRFPLSAAADVERAVAVGEARLRALAPHAGARARRRAAHASATCSSQRKEEIADLMTREMGKPLTETRGDVQEGIDTAYYAATEGRRLFGHTVPSELRNKWAMSFRRPIGVCGIITPFNFPLAIPTWKMFPALLCGNAVIFKPAEDVPHTGHGARRDPARGRASARGRSSSCTARVRTSGAAIVEHPGHSR